MQRREFVKAGVASWMASALGAKGAVLGQNRGSANENGVEIENSTYLVEVSRERGLIRRVLDKESGIELITEPRLADNFRLLVPLPDLEANYIFGNEQLLTSLEKKQDRLTLIWNGPLKNARGMFDVDVTLEIILKDEEIQFRMDVRNRTPHLIAEVWYPILGGITGIGERKDTSEMIPYAGGSTETNLFHNFEGRNPGAGLGITCVEAFWSYPTPMPMPWISLHNRKLNRTMYFACCDRLSRFKTVRFELHPGIGSRQYGSNWPSPQELGPNTPLGVKLHWAHYPYIREGQAFEGPVVILQFHPGDWHNSARIYRKWFRSQFPILELSQSWMRREMAFVDTMFLLPEGNVVVKFKNIPEWAKKAQQYGVRSVLVSGWNIGGHDGSYPYYDPDPRLGTWEDLTAALVECHKLGMKVYFFANIQPVRVDTPWYRRELHRYLAMDKWGVHYAVDGWGMGTLSAREGFTRVPIVMECSGIPAYRKIIVEKMLKLAQIGADGIHIDKLWPSPGLDFNPLSSLGPDQATSEGRLLGVKEIFDSCREVNPEFAISTECAWDRVLTYSTVGWPWQNNHKDLVPMLKYTFPEWLPGLVVPQPYDFTPVNNAVRYGSQIFVGPGNYVAPDSMAYRPMRALSVYIKELLSLLEHVKGAIYEGEFLDTFEAHFDGPEDTRYTVFRNLKTRKRVCVLVNLGEGSRNVRLAGFDGNESGNCRIYAPFEKVRSAKFPLKLSIPPQRLAIVEEE